MLPIFRIISVGGVTLAITILVLALIPPGGTHLVLAQHEVVARGALMDPNHHPEWRQFLIHAALRRADELGQLRGLRDTIIRAPDAAASESALTDALNEALGEPPAPVLVLAGLPASMNAAEPEDTTGSIGDNPGATLPIEIGETSSTELPVTQGEDMPPVIRLPALQVTPVEAPPLPPVRSPAATDISKKSVAPRNLTQRHRRKATPPAPEPIEVPPPFNIIVAIFGSLANAKAASQPSVPPAERTAAPPPVNRQALNTRAVTQ